MTTSLALLDGATRALAEAKTLDDITQIRDLAEAARAYAEAAHLGAQAINHATEVKLRAERRGGELIIEGQQAGVIAKPGQRPNVPSRNISGPVPTTLPELGVSRKESSGWQGLAELEDFEERVAEVKENGQKLSRAALYTSNEDDWHTPRDVIDRVVSVLGHIDLDPCSNDGPANVPASKHYRLKDDGLTQPWAGRVYMNPPYGRVIEAWVQKLVTSYLGGGVTEAVALVPSRTDTTWFRRFRQFPRCFVTGRLRFSESGSAPFPSSAVYLGRNLPAFVEAFAPIGDIYELVAE